MPIACVCVCVGLCVCVCVRVCVAELGIPGPGGVLSGSVRLHLSHVFQKKKRQKERKKNHLLVMHIRCLISGGTAVVPDIHKHTNAAMSGSLFWQTIC